MLYRTGYFDFLNKSLSATNLTVLSDDAMEFSAFSIEQNFLRHALFNISKDVKRLLSSGCTGFRDTLIRQRSISKQKDSVR